MNTYESACIANDKACTAAWSTAQRAGKSPTERNAWFAHATQSYAVRTARAVLREAEAMGDPMVVNSAEVALMGARATLDRWDGKWRQARDAEKE